MTWALEEICRGLLCGRRNRAFIYIETQICFRHSHALALLFPRREFVKSLASRPCVTEVENVEKKHDGTPWRGSFCLWARIPQGSFRTARFFMTQHLSRPLKQVNAVQVHQKRTRWIEYIWIIFGCIPCSWRWADACCNELPPKSSTFARPSIYGTFTYIIGPALRLQVSVHILDLYMYNLYKYNISIYFFTSPMKCCVCHPALARLDDHGCALPMLPAT